ncbi:putative ribonuclease H-like domain-containing protein [Tanacetum coccineum]
MAPRAVLMKTGLRPLNTARPVNTAHRKTTIYNAKPMSHFSKSSQSTVKRPYQIKTALTNQNFSQKLNTAKGKIYNAKPKAVNIARPNSVVVNAVRKISYAVKNLIMVIHKKKIKAMLKVDAQAYKDKTSGILKSFITEIENLVDKKVKIIRCDNETEFKNRVMSEFCKKKGIKREISVARTPQQNGVAERRNRTLIEAARTMLSDSKLPTTFWAEAVNTACYVQNRVLVVKPHNKTPYELFRGRIPALSFMRPFGCHVTILNTLDYLGKLDGKPDEGFFVGYSLNSKAFRVYNIRTRKVEENLHIRFLEDKPIIAGDRPKWLFDIDVLTKSLNYMPVVTGTNSNDSVDGSLFDYSSKNASNDEPQPSSDAGKKDDEGVSKENGIDDQEKPENSTQDVNTAGPSINTANTNFNTGSLNINTYGVQTRRMTKTINEQGFISAVYGGKTHEVLHTCLFACFLSQEEPNKVYRNKKYERGIVIRNKARLVAQCYTQEEGMDYDDVFIPVARIEAIRLFLAYASLKEFVVYQMNVKSAFLYGKIEEEVYVCQPLGFEDPESPDIVYKVEKALYGLHQAPRAWKEMCIEFEKMMHKRFQMSYMGELTFFLGLQIESTPMEITKPLLKDAEAEDVDVHLYRSMIGSLMYLVASRPDIMFDVYACARFQVTPKVSHIHAVKRIFSDYAGASLDRKPTTRGCQFLRSRLISWKCKKQTIVANSTTEAEYVAAASCCGQVLWIQNQMLDYGYNFMNTKIFIDNESTICIVKNPVFHSKTKHIEIRNHFIRDLNEKKLMKMIKIHTDQNVADLLTKAFDVGKFQYLIATNAEIQVSVVGLTYFWISPNSGFLNASHIRYALTENPTIYVSLINQFWQIATARTLDNREIELIATIYGKAKIVTEESVRRQLHLADSDGISSLRTTEIFDQLSLMGYVSTSEKLTFQKGHFPLNGDFSSILSYIV